MHPRRDWYTKEVGVAAPEWRDDVERLTYEPRGRRVARVGSKASHPIRRTTSEELMRPVVEPLPKGSSFVRDDAELATCVGQARSLDAMISLSTHEWKGVEADQSKKITFQRGGAPGWWVQADGLVVEERPGLRVAFRALWGWISSSTMEPGDVAVRYKQRTSHGFPDYATSELSYVLHALWAAASEDWDAYRQLGDAIAQEMDQAETPFSSILYNRAGPTAKELPAYDTNGLWPTRVATLRGLCCRRREVHGMPASGNMWQKRFADKLKHRLAQLPQLYHGGGAAAIALKIRSMKRIPGRFWSDDISSFDKNVRPNHQRELIEEINAKVSAEWARFKLHWKDVPLLSAAIGADHEAYLYEKEGGTPSGAIDTALDGTLINTARIIAGIARVTGRSEEDVVAGIGVWWDFLCQGDDTVLRLPSGIDPGEYAAASEYFGYPCKVSQGLVFLMHAFTEDGVWSPLAARVFQQTKFNEYGGIHPALELLSFIARTAGPFWTTNPFAGHVGRMCEQAEPFARYKVTPRRARDAVMSPIFVADARTASKLAGGQRRVMALLEAQLPSSISDFASTLLSSSADGPLLMGLDSARRARCHSDALRIAHYMGLSEQDRPARVGGLSADTSNLLDAVMARGPYRTHKEISQ